MCTSVIDHTYNGYYSEVVAVREIFCLQQGLYGPTKSYFKMFEVAISKSDIEKCTATTHVKLNKTYAWAYDDNVACNGSVYL